MADFAPAGPADAPGFAHGEVREVVVEDEFLLAVAAGVGIKFLRVLARSERRQRHRLGFAAGKDRGAMRAGQNAYLAPDRPHHVHGPSVEPPALVQNQRAHILLLDIIRRVLEDELSHLLRPEFLDKLLAYFLEDGIDGAFPGELAVRKQGGHDPVAREGLGFGQDLLRHDGYGDVAFLLAGDRRQLVLGFDERLAAFVPEFEGRVEIRLADLLGRAFIHDDVARVSHVNQIQVAGQHLRVGRVRHELALDSSDAHRTQRPRPRDVANRQRRGCADDAQDVGIVLAVGAEHHRLHLHFVVPTLGKERADGPVREPAGEDFLFGWPALAFEIAAGKPARRGRFFPVINREGEKILAGLGLGGSHRRDEHDGLAELHGDGAVRLFCKFPRLDNDLLVAQLGGYSLCHTFRFSASVVRETSVNPEALGTE